MDYHELDVLCGNLQTELDNLTKRVNKLEERNIQLEKECSLLRDQLRYAEAQVYSGPTM